MKRKTNTPSVWLVVLLILAFVVSGCGGGTTGTGGTGTEMEGRILESNNQPLSGVVVTLVETGDSDITDDQGKFSFAAVLPGGDLSLLCEKETSRAVAPLGVIEENAARVELTIEFKLSENRARVTELKVVEKTATPTPKPRKTRTPNPNPDSQAVATLAPQPAPTQAADGTPTVNPAPVPAVEVSSTPSQNVTVSPTPTLSLSSGEGIQITGKLLGEPSELISGSSLSFSGGIIGKTRIRLLSSGGQLIGRFVFRAQRGRGITSVRFTKGPFKATASLPALNASTKKVVVTLRVTRTGSSTASLAVESLQEKGTSVTPVTTSVPVSTESPDITA